MSNNIRAILVLAGLLAIGNGVFIATRDYSALSIASIIVLGTGLISMVISRKVATVLVLISLVLLLLDVFIPG